jgi:hypothetical protein
MVKYAQFLHYTGSVSDILRVTEFPLSGCLASFKGLGIFFLASNAAYSFMLYSKSIDVIQSEKLLLAAKKCKRAHQLSIAFNFGAFFTFILYMYLDVW